jgi:hypothetical protein
VLAFDNLEVVKPRAENAKQNKRDDLDRPDS